MSLFVSYHQPAACFCIMASSVETGYNRHLWGREVASILNIPLLCISSVGQYRVNLSLFREQPGHPIFSKIVWRNWYRGQGPVSGFVQKILVPKALLKRISFPEALADLRRSGSGMQAIAGHGLQIPSLLRLGVNVRTLLDWDFWQSASISSELRIAVATDTLGVAGNVFQTHFYNVGLGKLQNGNEIAANLWFLRNHRMHIAGGSFQMIAGLLRLGVELRHYAKTGELRGQHALFGALDAASGAGGIYYSRYLLAESRVTSELVAQNNILMGLAPMPSRLRWGMRGIGMVGNVVGLGLSLHAFYSAASDKSLPENVRHHRMISAGMGTVGSGMMLASSMIMASPAAGPFAGFLLIGGLAILAGQALFD